MSIHNKSDTYLQRSLRMFYHDEGLTENFHSLIESINLETDEALLTGESLPVAKTANSTFDEDTGAGDRLNVAYSSSTVTKGRAKAVVFSIVRPRPPPEHFVTCILTLLVLGNGN